MVRGDHDLYNNRGPLPIKSTFDPSQFVSNRCTNRRKPNIDRDGGEDRRHQRPLVNELVAPLPIKHRPEVPGDSTVFILLCLRRRDEHRDHDPLHLLILIPVQRTGDC